MPPNCSRTIPTSSRDKRLRALLGGLAMLLLPAGPLVHAAEDFTLVMIGNSMQGTGIDFPSLSRRIGHKVESLKSGGAMSAWKFATLWHVAKRASRPKFVLVSTRRNYVTLPVCRVEGKYGRAIKRAVAGDPALEKIIAEVAHPTQGGGDRKEFNFAKAVDRSFLPHMIRAVRAAGMQLILVRAHSRSFAKGRKAERVKQKYAEDLTAYLQTHGATFLDYQSHPKIDVVENYADGDHLNEKGRRAWTALVAADLKAILAGRRALNERTDPTASGVDRARGKKLLGKKP